MRIIRLNCESDQLCFDQRVHEVAVDREDEANWYGKPTSNPNCHTLQWPKFAWKKLKTKRFRKA